jgi:hypothetical protein
MLSEIAVFIALFVGAAALARYLFGINEQQENEALPVEQYSAPIGPVQEKAEVVIPMAPASFRGAPRYDLYDAPGVPSITPDFQTPPSAEVVEKPVAEPITNSPETVAVIIEAMTIASAATLVDAGDESAPSYLSDILPAVAFSASTRTVPDATGEPSVVKSEMMCEHYPNDYWDHFSC